jgi:large repetitive protein
MRRFWDLFRSRPATRRAPASRRPFRPLCEALEDRTLLDGGGLLALNDSFAVVHDRALHDNVLANDQPAGVTLTAQLVAGPAHGTLTLSGDGTLDYTPDSHYVGPDSFTYQAGDGTAWSDAATVSLDVTNAAPFAGADFFRVAHDRVFAETTGALFANDADLDGDPLAAVLVTGPAHGTLALSPDGTFSYTPDPLYVGPDSFTYQPDDGLALGDAATVSLDVANVPPLAVDDALAAVHDRTLHGSVLDNDADPDGDALTAALVAGPAHGTLSLSADGSFDYTPDFHYVGGDAFTYTVSDGLAVSDPATVTLDVTNAPPAAADDAFAGSADAVLHGDLLANDGDGDGDALAAFLATSPSHGTVALHPDGTFDYQPDFHYVGDDAFTYTVSDGLATYGPVGVTLTLSHAAPVAMDDAFAVTHDRALDASGLLANDVFDVAGGSPVIVLGTGPSHGTLDLHADGSFRYTPAAGYLGPDTFTYSLDDGLATSGPATVSLQVGNAAPSPASDAYAVAHDRPLAPAGGVLANDADPDGDAVTAVLEAGPSHGTLTLHPDGSFLYTPAAGYVGTDAFTYRASDGLAASDPATVSLTVTNVAPVAADDFYAILPHETRAVDAAAGVLANDTDGDGDALTASLVSGPSHGLLTLAADGSFTYTPAAGYAGDDTFTYRAGDGLAPSDPATVTLHVASPPRVEGVQVNDGDVQRSMVAGLTVTFSEVVTLAAGAFEIRGAAGDLTPATVTWTTQVVGGKTVAMLTFSGTDAIGGSLADDSYTLWVRADGVTGLAGPMAADASFAFYRLFGDGNGDGVVDEDDLLAFASAYGTGSGGPGYQDYFDYNADGVIDEDDLLAFADRYGTGGGGGSSGGNSPQGPGSPPGMPGLLAPNRAFRTLHDHALTGNLSLDGSYRIIPGVGQGTAFYLYQGPAHGAVSLQTNGQFTYTPNPHYVSTPGVPDAFFYYFITSGSASTVGVVTIDVYNHPPVANNDGFFLHFRGTFTGYLFSNDYDPDGDPIAAGVVTNPGHGQVTVYPNGLFTYTLTPGNYTADSFTYQDSDGVSTSGVPYCLLVPTDAHAPETVPDYWTVQHGLHLRQNVLPNDHDADGDPLTIAWITQPVDSRGVAHGSVAMEADGTFTYFSEAQWYGRVTFVYVATDGWLGSVPTTVTIDVVDPNAPQAVDNRYRPNHDHPFTDNVLANDYDLDTDDRRLLYVVTYTQPQHGTVAILGDGTFTYRPAYGYRGMDSFTYALSDGARNSNVATVTLEVVDDNAPVAVNDSWTVPYGFPLTRNVLRDPPGVDYDRDHDEDILFVAWNTPPAAGTGSVVMNPNGTFTYTPPVGWSGTATFTYGVSDRILGNVPADVTITVLPPPPGATPQVTFTGNRQFGPLDWIVTGYTLPVATSQIHATLVATISPKTSLSEVTLQAASTNVVLKNERRDDNAGTITVDVYGQGPTPATATSGEMLVEAWYKGLIIKREPGFVYLDIRRFWAG